MDGHILRMDTFYGWINLIRWTHSTDRHILRMDEGNKVGGLWVVTDVRA